MNPGTFYLYEYENNTRRRNVGFIKISRHYHSCILQINARGIPVGNGMSVGLYAFFRDSGGIHLTGTQIASLTCYRRNVSARISVAESRFPEGRPLMEMDGFLIRVPSGDDTLVWMASSLFFDVDIRTLHAPRQAESIITEEPLPTSEPAPEELLEAESQVHAAETETAPQAEESDDEKSEVRDSEAEAPTCAENKPQRTVRKISREDISMLPKKFWGLASNSFLLHGCHNYGHLVLIEEDGRTWLGVPGIYDPREARAADLFGFPHFTKSCVAALDLGPEECSDCSDFGHWCRCIGRCGAK